MPGNSGMLRKLCIKHSWICYYCNNRVGSNNSKTKPTIDHKVPKARGGSNKQENLVLACYSCNHRKGNMMEHEYIYFLKCIDAGYTKKGAIRATQRRYNILLYGTKPQTAVHLNQLPTWD